MRSLWVNIDLVQVASLCVLLDYYFWRDASISGAYGASVELSIRRSKSKPLFNDHFHCSKRFTR
jgi:hypothetical protein